MTLTRLHLTQFRSWSRLELDADDRPVAIHSENGLDHAMVALGCLYVGIPWCPVSPPYSIVNVDATLIAQKPKFAPYIDSMTAILAAVLGLPIDCVNVKATTTEGMGFTGRAEGVAADAVVLLEEREERGQI